MEDLLRTILQAIVEKPEAIVISKETVDTSVQFTIEADQEDMGKIIGKNGKTITAIRNLLKVMASKQGKWVTISVAERA